MFLGKMSIKEVLYVIYKCVEGYCRFLRRGISISRSSSGQVRRSKGCCCLMGVDVEWTLFDAVL